MHAQHIIRFAKTGVDVCVCKQKSGRRLPVKFIIYSTLQLLIFAGQQQLAFFSLQVSYISISVRIRTE